MTYKTLLVNLEAGGTNAHVLQAASSLAERFDAAVIGSTACAPVQMLYADCAAYGDIFTQDSREIATEIAAAEAEFRFAMGGRIKILGWRSDVVVTPLAEHLAAAAAAADLIVTGSAGAASSNPARQIILGELLMQAGRPVLSVGPPPAVFGLERILIAWNDTREARRAISDAMPLLQAAANVILVEITTEDDLESARARLEDVAAWLHRHGVVCEQDARLSTGDDAAALCALAEARVVSLVVAGAYGHGRLREWALGGVTRSLLHQSARAVLLSH